MLFSRIMSLLTLAYGLFAAVKPRHLADALEAGPNQPAVYDKVAYTFAGRDIAISLLGAAGPTRELVTAAMGLRIAGDFSDAATLGLTAKDSGVRRKVLAVTLTWAALNGIALAVDLNRDEP